MKSPEQRGPVGAWAYEERDRRDWSVERTVEELARQGVSISTSYLRSIESNSKPASGRVLRALKKLYESAPPEAGQPNGGPDIGELVTAIREQTAAIDRLVTSLGDRPPVDPASLAAQLGEALATHLRPLLDATGRHSEKRQELAP